MDNFNSKLIKSLINGDNVNKLLNKWLKGALNELLNNELSCFLHYNPYERHYSGDYRNGYYCRIFQTKFGILHIKIPRDRDSKFTQHVIPSYRHHSDDLERTIIELYRNGITTREIASLIKKMFGSYYSPQAVSNLTENIDKEVKSFKRKRLSSHYAVIYLDATYIPLRRGTYSKEAVYIAIGIRPNGHKSVLDFTIEPTESADRWSALLRDLKNRGVKSVLLFITDGLHGLPVAISQCFPQSKYQQCLVHINRDIKHRVRVRDRDKVMSEFSELHHAHDLKDGKRILKEFINKWQMKYPRMTNSLRNNHHLLTFLEFPRAIRTSIYNTNVIENFNSVFKRQIKQRQEFPNERSVSRSLMTIIDKYNYKFSLRAHRGFKKVQDTLESMFI